MIDAVSIWLVLLNALIANTGSRRIIPRATRRCQSTSPRDMSHDCAISPKYQRLDVMPWMFLAGVPDPIGRKKVGQKPATMTANAARNHQCACA